MKCKQEVATRHARLFCPNFSRVLSLYHVTEVENDEVVHASSKQYINSMFSNCHVSTGDIIPKLATQLAIRHDLGRTL